MRFLFLLNGVKGSWKKNVPCVFCSLMKVEKKECCCSRGLSSATPAVFSREYSRGRDEQDGCVGDRG